jgi:hypothetical protein
VLFPAGLTAVWEPAPLGNIDEIPVSDRSGSAPNLDANSDDGPPPESPEAMTLVLVGHLGA